MREERILVNGLKANYKIAGEGEPLLILHGWGGSSGSWIKVQEILAESGYMVIVPDFPGFGESVTPERSYDIKDYSDWVENFIEEIEKKYGKKIEPFNFLGHSFGGRVAIKFSVQHPEKIKKLIFCDAAGVKAEMDFKAKVIYTISQIGNAILTPQIFARFKDTVRSFFYLFIRHKDYVKAKGTMRETIKKVLDEDLVGDLEKITAQTLIIWGENDKILPVKFAYIFKEKCQNCQLEIMPKIGHSPHLEAPEKLAKIIISFLRT